MLSPLLSACLLLTLGQTDYPRPDLLIEADALAKAAGEKFVIIDVRPKARYEAAHVPGATWADHAAWDKAFAAKQDAAEWAMKLGQLGVGLRPTVVVYDDGVTKDAARVWWLLRYWGAKDVRLLNGGFAAWARGDHPTEAGPMKYRDGSPYLFGVKPSPRLATKKDVLDLLDRKDAQIVDARSEGEHCGDTKLAKRGGAIPGAKHLEWTELLDPKTKRFKDAAALRALFRDAGIDPARPAVTYCQSGGRAAVMAFALELMGGERVANYYRSWSEWGNDPDTPVAQPRRK